MKENSINLDKNSLKDSIYYPTYSINSGKNSRKRRKYSINFDINNNEIVETFDDNILKFYDAENYNNDYQHEDAASNLKLGNMSDISEVKYQIPENKIKNVKKLKKEKIDKKEIKIIKLTKFGRKKKNSSEKGIHDKYSSDNIIRKCKAVLLQIISNLINNKIKEFYGKNKDYNYKRTRLMKINQYQVVNSNVQFNQQFLYRKIKDIFSENLSSKCKRFSLDHNKLLINQLLTDKDKLKKKIFSDILNLTFLECLQHFRGSKIIPSLCDLKSLDEVCEELNGDEDYKESFKCYIDNYETIIINKKSRKNYKHNTKLFKIKK